MNVFDFAIRMEEDGMKLYGKLAEEAQEPEIKTIFRLLAAEEQRHRNIFEAMKKGEDPSIAVSISLQNARSAFRKLVEKKDPRQILRKDPDGYRHSIKAEEDFIRLYEELADKEKNQHVARLLRRIAEEERSHLKIMENIFDFMEAPKTFLAWGEFSNLNEL